MSEAQGPVINIAQLEYREHGHGEAFAARLAAVAPLIGGRKLGYRVVRVPPGKRAWPYHAHCVNEVMFFVLEGQGTLFQAGARYPLRAGDFVASPADPEQPHQIVNTSQAELCYLAVSTMLEPEVVMYPDSDKYGVLAGAAPGDARTQRGLTIFARRDAGLDYWDGEGGSRR